jgi:hypothetical protein
MAMNSVHGTFIFGMHIMAEYFCLKYLHFAMLNPSSAQTEPSLAPHENCLSANTLICRVLISNCRKHQLRSLCVEMPRSFIGSSMLGDKVNCRTANDRNPTTLPQDRGIGKVSRAHRVLDVTEPPASDVADLTSSRPWRPGSVALTGPLGMPSTKSQRP